MQHRQISKWRRKQIPMLTIILWSNNPHNANEMPKMIRLKDTTHQSWSIINLSNMYPNYYWKGKGSKLFNEFCCMAGSNSCWKLFSKVLGASDLKFLTTTSKNNL